MHHRTGEQLIHLIERGLAISHIEEILLTGDGIMVAGVIWALIFPLSSFPWYKKTSSAVAISSISRDHRHADAGIDGYCRRPTRAEVTDVAMHLRWHRRGHVVGGNFDRQVSGAGRGHDGQDRQHHR